MCKWLTWFYISCVYMKLVLVVHINDVNRLVAMFLASFNYVEAFEPINVKHAK